MNLISKVKNRLKSEKIWFGEFVQFINKYKNIEGDKILITGVPRHGNIGDQAILCGEKDFLYDLNYGDNYIEVTYLLSKLHTWLLNYIINKEDLILVHGGGFLGTLWIKEEKMCRKVIKTFKDNKIIIMPQTIYFEESKWGEKEKEISKRIYSNHPNLTVCLREKKSYMLSQELFKVKTVLLIPDMVLHLNYSQKDFDRNGCLLCIRRDKEKVLTDENENKIKQIVKKYFTEEEIRYTDTVVDYGIPQEESRNEVNKKIDEFAKSQLVITDRLHGMVLAAIAETPCIALGNCSGKVKGVYEWIKDLEYVEYVENLDNLDEAITKVMNSKNKKYNNEGIKKYYTELIKAINE